MTITDGAAHTSQAKSTHAGVLGLDMARATARQMEFDWQP